MLQFADRERTRRKRMQWDIRGSSQEVMQRLEQNLKDIGLLACYWEDISAIRERLGLAPIDKEGYPLDEEEE